MATWSQRLFDIVFPRSCEHCGGLVEASDDWQYLCSACAGHLDWIFPPFCETCGHPYPGIEAGRPCNHCEALEPVFATGRCCVLHREVGATLVRSLKYGRAEYLLADLGRMPARLRHVRDHVSGAVLVPVPLHRVRLRERGFNQSERLAEIWAEALPVRGMERLLERVRWTGSQTKLSREDRRRNMRRAFAIRSGMSVDPDLTYVVVDDVFTTGSTLNECCRALRRAGARHLRVLTLAHG